MKINLPHRWMLLLALVAAQLLMAPVVMAAEEGSADEAWVDDVLVAQAENNVTIADPLEPLNRVFFQFNDKLYFWLLKPVATGYKAVLSDEDVRMCFSNAFHNLLAPVRIVNNVLQGKMVGAGNELASFVINSTVGIVGLADPAHKEFGLAASDEDFGQTLGSYGIGDGMYVCWPFLGPSSLRDTVGTVGDALLDPLFYLTAAGESAGYALQGDKQVNRVSLNLGEYERFKEASFDPYVAVRNAYVQHRRSRIKDEIDGGGGYGVGQGKGVGKDVGKAPPPPPPRTAGIVVIDGPLKKRASKAPHTGSVAGTPGYYVLVGVYREPTNVERQKKRLAAAGMPPVVARYQRKDYSFYGVEVPGGGDFIAAKQREKELVMAGFSETLVVRH
ncbi:MAG: MlaA family lipoprotein [Desulfobulbaceae bacterium]|nr:MlaA family lipoprotein [Desulfobulbaceae bacterium]